jgi:hypothetical protein
VANAKALAESLKDAGLGIVSGGTDNHLMLVDLSAKDVTGKAAEKGLDRAWLTCNKNGVPFDKRSPFVTSGIRLGTPAGTTRGFREEEFRQVGQLIAQVVDGLARNGEEGDGQGNSACAMPWPTSAPVSPSTRSSERLRCPFCAHDNSQVKDSRPTEDNTSIRRRRHAKAAAPASPRSSACNCAKCWW